MDYKNDIFISYNWDIKPDVKNLYSILTRNGYSVWMDEKSMLTGHNLTNEIAEAIRRSRMIICCLTVKYSKSENCQREINFASDCKRNQKDKIILPILFEKVHLNDLGGVGFLVSNLLYIKYEKNLVWEETIIEQIRHQIKPIKYPKENSIKVFKKISEFDFREAVQNGDMNIVREYLQNNGDVNAEDTYGTISLHDASADGNLRMLKFLIDNNGDISKRDNLGQTILHWAVVNESESIVDYIANEHPSLIKSKCYYGFMPCHKAASKGSLKIIQLLLEKDLSILNSQDNDGNTMLHLATLSGHTHVIKYLVKVNANKNIKNERGKRPVDIAVQIKYKDVLNLLS